MESNKRLNIAVIFQTAVLLAYAVLFIMLVINGSVKQYVHPRINPYLMICGAAFMIIALFNIKNIYSSHSTAGRYKEILILALPLVFYLLIPSSSIMVGRNMISELNVKRRSEINLAPKQYINLVLKDENYIELIEDIYNNIDKYTGKKICITGFVLRNESLKQGQFIVARLLMSCCSADAATIGLICSCDQQKLPENGSWVQAEGILTKLGSEGDVTPSIKVMLIKQVQKPENVYIYSR